MLDRDAGLQLARGLFPKENWSRWEMAISRVPAPLMMNFTSVASLVFRSWQLAVREWYGGAPRISSITTLRPGRRQFSIDIIVSL